MTGRSVLCWCVLALACDAQPAQPPDGTPDATVADTPDPLDTTADAPDATPEVTAPVVPGAVVWRRLNRTEYRNTVRDLFTTSTDPGEDLPSDDLGYGFCSLSLERETPEGWIQVSPTPEVCPGVLIVLTPGTRAARRQAIDPTLPPGSYRLRQQVMPGAKLPEISVVSAAFALRAPD